MDMDHVRTSEYSPGQPLLVSVIIPVYNVFPYLEEALDSVIGQTYKDLEIIIVDDGSTDGSSAVCDRYAEKDSRVKVIHQSNKGLSGARNAGLGIKTGQIVAFLDSDDIMQRNMIERMVLALTKTGSDIAICRFLTFNDPEEIEKLASTRKGDGTTLTEGVYGRSDVVRAFTEKKISHNVWNKIYRSELWDDLRFPDGHVYEDSHTTFTALEKSGKIFILNDILYFYRARTGSITHFNSVSNVRDFLLSREQLHKAAEALVPDTISTEQFEGLKRSCLTSAIFKFANLNAGSDEQSKKEISALRQEIIELGNTVDMSSCGIPLKAAWRMLNKFPGALSAAYPIVRAVYELSKKLRG